MMRERPQSTQKERYVNNKRIPVVQTEIVDLNTHVSECNSYSGMTVGILNFKNNFG